MTEPNYDEKAAIFLESSIDSHIEMERRLAAIVESSDDAIVSKDLNGIITSWNRGAERTFGYKADEIMGKPIHILIPDDRQDEEPQILSRIQNGERVDHYETIRRRKDGTLINVSITISPIKNAQGKIIGASKIARDITVAKRAEVLLKESEERFRILLDLAPVGIFMTNAAGDCLFVNKHWTQLSGMKLEDAKGLGWAKALHSDDRERVSKEWHDSIKNSTQFVSEYRFVHPNGKISWIQGSALALQRINGETSYIGTLIDITERKNAEEITRQNENHFRLLAHSVPVLIWMNGLDGCEFVNKKYLEFLGAEESRVLGFGWSAYIHPDDLDLVVRSYQKAFSAHSEYHIQHRFLRYDGQYRWMKTVGLPRYDANGDFAGYVGSTIDITEIKIAEEELERSNMELEHFAYVISHDLQEPLRMVTSYTQLFAKRYEKNMDENASKLIGFMSEGALRSQRLVKDLLEYSRVRPKNFKFSKINSEDALRAAISNLSVSITESRVKITHDHLPVIKSDRTRLIQLFQNLLSNAIKFRKKRSCQIHISAKKNKAGEWLFSVKDNGIGIATEHRERIFIIFQRLHNRNEYEGTGIGLAICKKIVEQHNGRIWVDSIVGKGSTFYFTINTHWH